MTCNDKGACLRNLELHDLRGKINTSPIQQFTLSQFESFLPHLLVWPTSPDAWCNSRVGHHLFIHSFDKLCSNFKYYMISSEAGRCVFFELGIVIVLYLKKNEVFEYGSHVLHGTYHWHYCLNCVKMGFDCTIYLTHLRNSAMSRRSRFLSSTSFILVKHAAITGTVDGTYPSNWQSNIKSSTRYRFRRSG